MTDVAAPSGDIKVPKALKVPKDPKAEKAEAEKAEKAEKAEAIKDRVSFGKGKGKAGQPDGNSADGAVSGIAASGLGNRKAVSLPSPDRREDHCRPQRKRHLGGLSERGRSGQCFGFGATQLC